MTQKFKLTGLYLATFLLLAAVIGLLGCTGAAPQAPAAVAAVAPSAAVIAVPNTVAPLANAAFIGANFNPGEELDVYILAYPNTPQLLGTAKAEGKALKADELGSFQISDLAPAKPGVYPIRVLNKKNELRAVSLLIVQAPPKK
jgi:hypothetical protein